MAFIVAIDGPTSSGKSTLAKRIAKELGFINIQTGAMYRCVAKQMQDSNIGIENTEEIETMLKNINISFRGNGDKQIVLLNGDDVTLQIRSKEITDFTSKVASILEVREALVEKQREMAQNRNVVMEGRDIGTNVFPQADIKIYLDANPLERIKRKILELKQNGEEVDELAVANSVYNWDEDAVKRKEGALKKAEDAIYIDSTQLSIDELARLVIGKINEKYIDEMEL